LGLVAGKSEDVRADTHRTHRTKGNNAVFRRTVGFRYRTNLTRSTDARKRDSASAHRDGANRAVGLDTCDVCVLANDGVYSAYSASGRNAADCYSAGVTNRARIAIRMKARNQREREWVNVV
jgi:hypothetical protein